jgi:DNA-binding PadR family transcriptional regulator
MEHEFDGQFGGGWFRGGHRMGRGDMSPIVLYVLLEKPMHGYEIIRKLEEQCHGFWRPSPGSIYPTLTLLEEQDLVTSHEEDGKKVYTLTEEGRRAARSKNPFDHMPPHWKEHLKKGKRFGVLKDTMKEFITHMRIIGVEGSDEHIARAKGILDNAVHELAALADEVQGKTEK